MRKFSTFFLVSLALGVFIASCGPKSGPPNRKYILTTASTGGTYYPVGVALATLVKLKNADNNGLSLSAINSAGSAENVQLLRKNEAQFAILQGLYGLNAWRGEGSLKTIGPQKKLRSITALWQNVEHFVLDSKLVETGTVEDLKNAKGRTLALGKKNSGAFGSSRKILSNLGFDVDRDFQFMHGGYGPSADALQNGQVSGLNTPAGVPVSALTRLFAARGERVRLLSFTSEQAKQADAGRALWTPYRIPSKTYPGQPEDILTIAQPNFLAVTSDVPEDDVYQITKTIYDNVGFLQAYHKATKNMSLETALSGLPVPLHPGALRFFREKGVLIPERLIAKPLALPVRRLQK